MPETQAPLAAFVCRICGDALTEFLVEVDESDLVLEMSSNAVAPGHYCILTQPMTYREFTTGRKPGWHYLSADGDITAFEAGDFCLNIASVKCSMKKGAVAGCCGWQPRAEANACCANGHDIGTVHSDCPASYVMRLHGPSIERIFIHGQ